MIYFIIPIKYFQVNKSRIIRLLFRAKLIRETNRKSFDFWRQLATTFWFFIRRILPLSLCPFLDRAEALINGGYFTYQIPRVRVSSCHDIRVSSRKSCKLVYCSSLGSRKLQQLTVLFAHIYTWVFFFSFLYIYYFDIVTLKKLSLHITCW